MMMNDDAHNRGSICQVVGGFNPPVWCLQLLQVFIDLPTGLVKTYIADPPLVLPQIKYWS